MRRSEKKFRTAQANLLYWEIERHTHPMAPAVSKALDLATEEWEQALQDLLIDVWRDGLNSGEANQRSRR